MTTETKIKAEVANAGLPGAPPGLNEALIKSGINPERLSVLTLGIRQDMSALPRWAWRMSAGLGLWILFFLIRQFMFQPPEFLHAFVALIIGLIILQSACEILISATEQLAARFKWDHYIAGTVAEILSTTPELVVIAFIIPVSPMAAFIVSVITIYNNSLVFSLYSFFLPKDRRGKFLMPTPITEAGTQILIGGGAMGLILGLVMLSFNASGQAKNNFNAIDLVFVSFVLLTIFIVYLYKLVTSYAKEEAMVRDNLSMSAEDIDKRLDLVYQNVRSSSFFGIAGLFLVGVSGAFLGGEQVSEFATTMIDEMAMNEVLTAMVLAIFAGMSEYVIVWQSHKKKEYGIALANAFGGITQVMFMVLPFTLLAIAFYQVFVNPAHPELPIRFSLTTIFLLLFLFPTFYTLSSLLEEDHTLGLLDTTIMTTIFLFLIVLLVMYGG